MSKDTSTDNKDVLELRILASDEFGIPGMTVTNSNTGKTMPVDAESLEVYLENFGEIDVSLVVYNDKNELIVGKNKKEKEESRY